MAIDAPFALTTSREEIETESIKWNSLVREELYSALLLVIDSLKEKDRSKIFRFIKYRNQAQTFINEISDCRFLNRYDFLQELKRRRIIPTFDKNCFAVPQNNTAIYYPEVVNWIFKKLSLSGYTGIVPSSVIDYGASENKLILSALGCKSASFEQALLVIEKHTEQFIRDAAFRSKLYDYIKGRPQYSLERIKKIPFIPVYKQTPGETMFISWEDDNIFVKPGTTVSGSDYYVLNEGLMPKAVCEGIFNRNINEMNVFWERARYNERLKAKILGRNDNEVLYDYLLDEYNSGAFNRNNSFPTLLEYRKFIPLKNELGNIVDAELFICDKRSGYFSADMIRKLTVHEECAGLAKKLLYRNLSEIDYDDIDYYETLTADDVKTLLDDYFKNSENILLEFYRDGLLPDNLLSKYELDYLSIDHSLDDSEKYEFPSDPVVNRESLKKHVRKLWQDPVKVVSVKEERTVQKGQNKDGTTFDLGKNDARDGALFTYTPEGARDLCFCQMCHSIKPYKLIEVNNIELRPKYFFPQLRVSLCLECSKRFEYLRSNAVIRKQFIEAIKGAPVCDGIVNVQIGRNDTIAFTAKHLAEIQEILLQMPD